MASVLDTLPNQEGQQALALAAGQPELMALAAGSPGALLEHVRIWTSIPDELKQRLQTIPRSPVEAMALARDLSDQLEGEQQLWLIGWWQQHLWRAHGRQELLIRLDRLRQHLLSFVQPRLAWEVALLNLSQA